jgi:hypothetical protein
MYHCLTRTLLPFYFCASFLYCGVQACGTLSNNPWTVQLPSATTPIYDLFTASIAGVSYDGEFSIAITSNAGNVTQNNRTTEVIVKDQIGFGGSLVLYSLIGTDADSILMGWAYCSENELTSLFLEVTDGASGFTKSTVTGSCNITNEATSVNLLTNAECLNVARPSAVPTIDGGNQLSLQNGSVGSVALDSEEFNLIPFAIVDCSDCSASTLLGGWFEVHSVMTGKTSADICLGIFYLSLICSAEVTLQYVQCFIGNATSQSFNADYDLSSVIKNPAEVANATCKASSGTSPSTSSPTSSPTSSSAGPEFKIPFLALPITLVVGLSVTYS